MTDSTLIPERFQLFRPILPSTPNASAALRRHFLKWLAPAWLMLATASLAQAQPANASDAGSPPLPSGHVLEGMLAAHDVPGIAMATLKDCEVEDAVVVAGRASLSPTIPVTKATAFEAASLSKPVFAWLVMQLADEKRIDLDRPFADTFRYERITDKASYAKLTPRMVLTHRTGLPNWVDEGTPFHQRVAAIPFVAPPGTVYSYSGEAFQLLQAYVEKTTGSTLQQLFKARLGRWMPDSTFVQPLPAGTLPSRGYDSAKPGTAGRDMMTAPAMAAGSLVTTAKDYARFLSLVCKREGLSRAAYQDMLRAQSPVPAGNSPFKSSYGLGWVISDLGGSTAVSHSGNNGEYRAFAAFVNETREGIVILTNGAKGEGLIDVLVQPGPEPKPALGSP